MDNQTIETEIKRLEKAIDMGEVCNSAECASVYNEIIRLKKLLEPCNKCASCMGFPGYGQCAWWERERLK